MTCIIGYIDEKGIGHYNDIHPLIDISFGELYNRTITRLDEIRNAGYTVVHI